MVMSSPSSGPVCSHQADLATEANSSAGDSVPEEWTAAREEQDVTTYPTGEQIELRHGDQTAVVVRVGGGLRTYDVAGRAVLDGFDAAARIDGSRGQVLAPWPNRVRDGRYEWAGETQQLALSEARTRNAIHGLVRWSEWSVTDWLPSRVTVSSRVWPQTGYPFLLDVSATYVLDDEGMSVTLTGSNAGDEVLPYGVGQHPYITAGTELVDDAVLTLPAEQWLPCDDRGLPTSTEPVEGTAFDFRSGRRIGDTVLDNPFAALTRDGAGRVVVRLARADGTHGVDLWCGEGADYLQVFSGETLTAPRQRRGLAVEPMSCLPDAFNSGVGLVRLEPGESHTLQWGLHAW
jgi:aldose 1-epimerase